MKGKLNRESFLDDAERVIRGYASENPKLVVWRGKYGRKIFGSVAMLETIIAGLSDEPNSAQPPSIAILKVWLDVMAEMEFATGVDDDCHLLVPFGGGWNPLSEVEVLAEKLPSIF
ncbi:MAG: hypothetical protein Q8O59_00060 [bacterium]|nr:hypothetical protein [bacterium]